jgi:hypothetical protein
MRDGKEHYSISTSQRDSVNTPRGNAGNLLLGCRTVKKLAPTVWAFNRSEVIDRLEVLGGSRAVIQRVGDSL